MNRTGQCNRHGGIAMLLVMGAVAFAFVVGLAVLSEVPAATRGSGNLIDRHRLADLAESGLAEAMFRMKHRQGPGVIWSGVTGRRVDERGGTYDVQVSWMGGDDYKIVSTGRMVDGQGRVRSHGVYGVCRVTYENRQVVSMDEALYVGVDATLPWGLQIAGNVVVNGTLDNQGVVSGVITLLDGGASAASQIYASVDAMAYRQYEHNGAAGDSAYYQWTGTGAAATTAYQTWLKQYDAALRGVPYDSGGSVPTELMPKTEANPLGVIVIEGNVKLSNDLRIRGGMLVVKGSLDLNGKRLEVEGVDGQLGMVVTGDLVTPGASRLEVEGGPAYVGGGIRGNVLSTLSDIRFDSGLVLQGGFESLYRGNIRIEPVVATRNFSYHTLNDPLDPLRVLRPVESVQMVKFGRIPRNGDEAAGDAMVSPEGGVNPEENEESLLAPVGALLKSVTTPLKQGSQAQAEGPQTGGGDQPEAANDR